MKPTRPPDRRKYSKPYHLDYRRSVIPLPRNLSHLRSRLTRRDGLLILASLALLYLFYTAHNSSNPPESISLERYMNSPSPEASSARTPVFRPSSFNWSSITPAHSPPPPLALPQGRHRSFSSKIQRSPFPHEPARRAKVRSARRAEVRALARANWASYRTHAWLDDALLPIAGTGTTQFAGWAATLVDSLDTLWIMGLRPEFDEAVAAVAAIDFGKSKSTSINMFETNIRYLGGLLGAYDLSKRPVLLQKARELGDMLFSGFDTPNRMPVDFFGFEESKRGGGLTVEAFVASAGPGTLTMEFARLSQLTGDAKYYTAISRMMDVFERGQNRTHAPGLWPTTVSMRDENVVDGRGFTLGGGADSTYEYVTKMWPLLGGQEARYRAMTIAWMDAANETMLYRPMLPHQGDKKEDVLFSGNLDFDERGVGSLDPESEHLACFLGGTYALAGRLFNRKDYLTLGEKLARGCAYAYRATATGIMCERFNAVKCASRTSCAWDEKRWEEEKVTRGGVWREGVPMGFTTCKDPRYILRPEAIESVFYLWRITGDVEWQETAWEMFAAVGNGTRTEYANAAVKDVTSRQRPFQKEDYMEVSYTLTVVGGARQEAGDEMG